MDLVSFTGQFWTINKMPDTKSGIKHLSNMASMHQNIFVSLRNVFNKQFKSNMKIYSKEMNLIKEDLARLRREKERYLKQDESHKRAMNLSTGETSSDSGVELTRKEVFEEIKRQNVLDNKSLTQKVNTFSHTSPQPSKEAAESLDGIDKVDAANRYIATGSQWTDPQRRLERADRPSRMYSQSNRMEDFDELEEDEVFATDSDLDTCSRSEQTPKPHPPHRLNQYSAYKPNFRNDRFVNTTVNNARAKLTSLYRQSILGPSSHKRNISLILPLSPGTRPSTVDSKTSHRANPPRSQSTAEKPGKPNEGVKPPARKSKSARPSSSRKPSGQERRASSGKQVRVKRRLTADLLDAEDDGQRAVRKRERFLLDVQDGLYPRYNDFEQALHRRMMIREMKAAEYDANHSTRSNISLQEVIPTKSSAMSEALRRQSAIIALERSILGGVH